MDAERGRAGDPAPPAPADPAEILSKRLWQHAEQQLRNNNIVGAIAGYQEIVLLDHPAWAPGARAELGRLTPPVRRIQQADTMPTVAESCTAPSESAHRPTTSAFRRCAAAAVDVLPILIFFAVAFTIATTTPANHRHHGTFDTVNQTWVYVDDYSMSAAGNGAIALAGLGALAYALWNWLYRQGRTGATVGKSMLGFKVLNEATGQPSSGIPTARVVKILVPTLIAVCVLALMVHQWAWDIGVDYRRQ